MAQYDINKHEYVDRNNNLFKTKITTDEYGEISSARYSKDGLNRNKCFHDYSLFSSSWSYGVNPALWEELIYDRSDPDPVNQTVEPIFGFNNVVSEEGMNIIKSGIVLDLGTICQTKQTFKVQPNRSQIFSAHVACSNAIYAGYRAWGISTIQNGVLFRLIGDGENWDLRISRRRDFIVLNEISITEKLPDDFDTEKLHKYTIQYTGGSGIFHFFIDGLYIFKYQINNTEEKFPFIDSALPILFDAVCVQAGVEVELACGYIDISTEGGIIPKTLNNMIYTGESFIELGLRGTDTGVLALRVPRYITYNSIDYFYTRGAIGDKLVTWTRDEAITKIFLFRDTNAPNLIGLTWEDIDNSHIKQIIGGNETALNTAFQLDKAAGILLIAEFADSEYKNIITNPSENSDYFITPGDIIVVSINSTQGINDNASATFYFSEET